jgi:hypothetical protein
MMPGTAGATADDQRLVVELTNIAYCDIIVSLKLETDLSVMTSSYGCFAWPNSEEQPEKRDDPAVFQSAEPSTAKDFRGG